jgi:SAM-dependent methyltransferase
LGTRNKQVEISIWDKFWAGKQVQEIYPPVTDITRELLPFVNLAQKNILEVGAGTGRDSVKMCGHGAKVFLLDYSSESLRLARQNLRSEGVVLVLANGLTSPFPDNTFDVVFHQGLLEHFRSPHLLLKENRRILKNRGLIVVDVPQTFHFYTLAKQMLQAAGLWFAGWERQFTIRALADLLKAHGFQPVHYYGDWSRPGIFFRMARQAAAKVGIRLPMYPKYFGKLTEKFYARQEKLRKKHLFLYTTLSIGIIARKI